MKRKIRIAIVGCGQIAEAHLREIAFINDAITVAVCDVIPLLAEDLAERFNINGVYTDFKAMIDKERPDVVHVTTPPHTHLRIGREVIQSGCHAYIEKPFGTTSEEVEQLIDAAEKNGVIVCAGFSQLHDRVAIKFKEFIRSGRLGEPVHVESYYGDSLDGSYSKLFLNDKNHWIHKLPGKLFHNIISHPLYHIASVIDQPVNQILSISFDRSENGVFKDELRVIMRAGKITAYMIYSTSIRPIYQICRFYGTRGIAEMDLYNHIFSFRKVNDLPGPLSRIANALDNGIQMIQEGIANTKGFITGKDRFFSGMGETFRLLYQNIREGKHCSPVSYSIVRKVATIIDEVAQQCRSKF